MLEGLLDKWYLDLPEHLRYDPSIGNTKPTPLPECSRIWRDTMSQVATAEPLRRYCGLACFREDGRSTCLSKWLIRSYRSYADASLGWCIVIAIREVIEHALGHDLPVAGQNDG